MTLEPIAKPAHDAGTEAWTAWIDDRGRGGIAAAKDQIAALRATPAGDPAILERWNDAAIALSNAAAVGSLFGSVHPDAAIIELAEQIEVEAEAFSTDLYLDRAVYDQLNSVARDGLDADAQRVLDKALQGFTRSGVDRDDATREQVRGLKSRLTDLGQSFDRNIRDGRTETKLPASALAGLPDDYVAEHPADADGMVTISTDYPDIHPFLTYAEDAAARAQVATAFFNLGYPANEQVLHELLDTRHELATLLGYADWPSYDAEIKMIGSGPAIPEFIDRISAAAGPRGQAEIDELTEVAGEPLDIGNWRYWYERAKTAKFDLSSQEVRRYFDFTKVHDGLLAVTGRLFGISYVAVDAPSWHPDVTSYDVMKDGERIGRIHLDLHPRARKYNHAAQFDLVSGVLDRQLPEGVLVCNFPRGLMDHRDVVTLFHEFGHLLHHVFAGRHRWVRFSGVATEWDFVEAPSQMLEQWAWDADVLRTFASDENGHEIPADLVERMVAADEFGKGFLARTQMFYAAIAYYFHAERPADLTARMMQAYSDYSLVAALPDTHFYAGFGHLEGYSSAYYTYMWSQVIAKDMFSAFDRSNLFAPETAARYRDRVLTPGGSRDAAELVEDFLGRPYNADAFEAWLNGSS